MILVEDIYKRYQTDSGPGKWVLQGISFTIPPKLNVGLVGCNGAGKSTLLRLIGGIDVPNRGRIERNCRVSWPMGFGGGLQGSLTGRQNAKFVCRIHGHVDDIPDRIAYIQEFAELGDAFDQPVKTYSSGMRSRLQFGLSLAFDFDVYISDEVTAAGDAAFRSKAVTAFKNLANHASLIMVSHDEGTLKQFCTAGIWLNTGQAHWFDDIGEALKAYKDSQPSSQTVSPAPQQKQDIEVPPPQDSRQLLHSVIAEMRQRQEALDKLEKGLNGFTVTADDEEGKRILREAGLAKIALIGSGQIATKGYRLKPNEQPVLRKYYPAYERYIDIYDLYGQCVKVENAQ
ncbi:MAG: ABC transporter ATP-binding protein [Nitrosomonadales bacterium]|nr:ABC transporter ATP-binding protein [Nitrosomonadales bacterium]